MWYLDEQTEQEIIKNMEIFGYMPKAAKYTGESKSGNYKFSYGIKQLVFSKQGKLLSGAPMPAEAKKSKKPERRGQRKREKETFKADYNRAKPHIEMLLKEDNPLFLRISLANQKPSQTEINLIYAKNKDSLEGGLDVYQLPLSFHTSGYERKDNDAFTTYVVQHIKANRRMIEKAYEKAVKKNMPALKISEDDNSSYTAHPTQGFYIYLKKAEAKISCQADSSKCFFVEYDGNGMIRTPKIKPAAPSAIKKEMQNTICQKDVFLSDKKYREIKKYINGYQQWADKLLDAVNYPSGCINSYNTTPKCQIKGTDFSTVFVGSGIFIQNGKIRFVDGAEKEFEKKRFQTAFHDAKELLCGYHYISGKGVLRGDTKIWLARSGDTFINVIHVPCYKDSLTAWRKQLKKEIKRIDKEIEEQIKKQGKALTERYGDLLADFLTQDILKTVALNNDYITENTLCSILRGTKVNLRDPQYTENAGRYNIFSKEEIAATIVHLLKEGFLTRKKIDGCYGVYYLLKLTPNGQKCLSLIPFLKKGGSIDAEKRFQRLKKQDAGVKQCLALLDLIFEDRSFFCVCQNEIFSFLKKAPKEFKILIKMRKATETEKYRLKIYREILKI